MWRVTASFLDAKKDAAAPHLGTLPRRSTRGIRGFAHGENVNLGVHRVSSIGDDQPTWLLALGQR